RRPHAEDEARPPRRQPPGPGAGQPAGDDHQPEPWLRRGRKQLAGERAGHPPFAVRRFQPGHRAHRCPGLQLPGSPGSQPRPARRGRAVRSIRGHDVGRKDGLIFDCHPGESVMKRVLQTLILLAALVVPAAMAGQARLPVGDFFKDPEFTSVSLSPTGEYITVSVPQGDRTLLAAFRVDGMELVGKWDYGPKRHIDRVLWVNDERFLMFVSRKEGRFDFRVGTPDVYASNVDGTQRADMPNLGYYQIADVTWDDPRTILVQRSIESAFLSKFDVYNGRVITVASAPLRYGGFVLDHEGQVRYAVGQDEENNVITLRRKGDGWERIHSDAMGGSQRIPVGFG